MESSMSTLKDHDRRIDENPKVDGSDGDQISRVSCEHHQGEGKQEREGDCCCRDQSHMPVSQRNQQKGSDKDQAHQHQVFYGVGGDVDKVSAVVECSNFHPAGKQSVVESCNLLAQCSQSWKGRFTALKQNNTLHFIRAFIDADAPEGRLETFMDLGQISEVNWNAVMFSDEYLLHLIEVAQQSKAAHIDTLAAQSQIIAAHVFVARGNCVDDLGKGHLKLEKLSGIDFSLILTNSSSERCHIDDAWHLFKLPPDEPILGGGKLVEGIARPFKGVAVNLPDWRPGRPLG